MKEAPFRGPLNRLCESWCKWCVDHERFVPLAQWCGFTHDTTTGVIIMAPLNDNVGIDGSWGCWLEWMSPTKLEIGYSFLALCSAAADFVQREICRRFDVRRIGAAAIGWYPEKAWQSTDPKGAPACYPGYSDWVTWAKDYKPEWSGHLPKKQMYVGKEALFEKVLADTLRDLRKVEAFVETKFKELEDLKGKPLCE